MLCLHGFVKVFKHCNAPGEGISKEDGYAGTGRGKRGTEYWGNGLASLFEDEIVLCGEGRLGLGVYSFKFDVQLPSDGLPSSIDVSAASPWRHVLLTFDLQFERGTISYMITSTLTRPTTINPTSSCDRKIYVVEAVDIAQVRRPKPRTITLEPIPRRTRAQPQSKRSSLEVGEVDPISTNEDRSIFNRTSSSSTVIRAVEEPRGSPVTSEPVSISAISDSNRTSHIRSALPSINPGLEKTSQPPAPLDLTISATAELQTGGCLPGDVIPVKVMINHTKVIKSVQGIIITLYRIARIDTHPALPIGPTIKGKKPVYEDYYPKSLTGLGGLSLSTAGSSQIFRMDLSQKFAPLIIDPTTLSTVVKTSIRVPEDIFPTISSVPGNIISFHYFVEVVMDIRGKLASQDRFLPIISMTGASTPFGYSQRNTLGHDDTRFNNTSIGSDFQDTVQIRREKSVVACIFEVIVGTKDSKRKSSKKTFDGWDDSANIQQRDASIHDPRGSYDRDQSGDRSLSYSYQDSNEAYEESAPTTSNHNSYPSESVDRSILIHPPQMEEPADEKARIRRAEEQLLPSAPPMDEDDPSRREQAEPSAPPLELLQNRYEYDGSSAPAYVGPSTTTGHRPHDRSNLTMGPSAQRERCGNGHPSVSNDAVEDKQELERQRLLAAASSPEDENQDEGSGNPRSSRIDIPTPSAPVIDEDDEYEVFGDHVLPHDSSPSGNHDSPEGLPRYQK